LSHAYAIIGVYTVTDESGTVTKLVHMFNPWRKEQYKGPWSDFDYRWTEHLKAQVPFEQTNNDGKFFIDIVTFKASSLYFVIQFYRSDFQTSFYDRRGDDGTLGHYTFTTTAAQDLHVIAETYDPRLYAFGCKTSKIMA